MKCRVCGHRKYKCMACAALEPPPLPPLEGAEVVVPAPPLLTITPKLPRCVVTLALGAEAEAMLAVAEPFFARYAERCGADFHVMRDFRGHPAWPMSAKFGLARYLRRYSHVAYFDADVLTRKGAVDVFALAGGADFAACDTLTHHRLRNNQVPARYAQFCERYGYAPPLPFYFNCGVWVARPRAHDALTVPNHPIIAAHCAEEWCVNARLGGLDVRCIDRRANWQNWTDPGFREAPADAVLHWSGGGLERIDRAKQMEEVARGCS